MANSNCKILKFSPQIHAPLQMNFSCQSSQGYQNHPIQKNTFVLDSILLERDFVDCRKSCG